MSKKSKTGPAALLEKIEPRFQAPPTIEGLDLMEHGLLFVLALHLTEAQADQTVRALKAAYGDWNEPRVAQVQELVRHVKTKNRGAAVAAARALKDYLQDVFQKNHGFDLEFLRDTVVDAAKFVVELTELGAAGGLYLLWQSQAGTDPPVSAALVRTLDRLGLIARTQSLKKAVGLVEKARGEVDALTFTGSMGVVIDNWCHARAPLCHECPLSADCPHGSKAHKEWLVQQKRLEDQRRREEVREAARHKKEEQRMKREEERENKRREAEEKRLARERERAERAAAKEKEKRDRSAARAAAEAAAAKAKAKTKAKVKVKKASGAKAGKGAAAKRASARTTVKPVAAKSKPTRTSKSVKSSKTAKASKKAKTTKTAKKAKTARTARTAKTVAKAGARKRPAKTTAGGTKKKTKSKPAAARPKARRRRA